LKITSVLREFQTEIHPIKIFLFVVTAQTSSPSSRSPKISPILRQYKLIQIIFATHISRTHIQPPTQRKLILKCIALQTIKVDIRLLVGNQRFGVRFLAGTYILFSIEFKPAMGKYIQWYCGATSSGQRGRSLKLTTYLHVVPKGKKSRSYASKCRPGLIVGCSTNILSFKLQIILQALEPKFDSQKGSETSLRYLVQSTQSSITRGSFFRVIAICN
jgi:hypothetical protein